MNISENEISEPAEKVQHRFLDEAGDTTFFGRGKKIIIGQKGVSKAFYLGCLKLKCPLDAAHMVVEDAKARVLSNPALSKYPSVQKRIAKDGFYFHAKDDPLPIRQLFFDAIRDLSCSLEIIVARKDARRFDRIHHRSENEFYADLLSHLLKGKLKLGGKLIFFIAHRGSSTAKVNLTRALEKANSRAEKRHDKQSLVTRVAFEVRNPAREPLLALSDYLSWAVQRVFECGDTQYYDQVVHRISVINDIYDADKYNGYRNWYSPNNPLTAENKIWPTPTLSEHSPRRHGVGIQVR